ncbi:hypothetical protein [Herpetosiphon giganteus]|uniref:hypothetical protein n=1 Tax=Herpetosiphon giganteus TaxID=2029754 RepID=UPI001956B61A|nr:hypothetical protein [Herpetosiphon giganteus]MBM7845926.1 hypothetical protein [Herpetosiphon giganteus]
MGFWPKLVSSVHSRKKQPLVWFKLEIREESRVVTPSSMNPNQWIIDPSKTYAIHVCPVRGDSLSSGVMEFQIAEIRTISLLSSVPDMIIEQNNLIWNGVSSEYKFSIKVNKGYKIPAAEISILVKTTNDDAIKLLGGVINLMEDNSNTELITRIEDVNMKELEKIVDVDMNYELPYGYVIIYVNRQSDKEISIQGFNGKFNINIESIDIENDISIEYLIKNKRGINDIISALSKFSRDFIEIGGWFIDLCEYFNDDLNIIIIDNSNKNIPWEFIKIKSGKYIGYIAKITRWIKVSDFDRYIRLRFDEKEVIGYIMPYIDHEDEYIRNIEVQMIEKYNNPYRDIILFINDVYSQLELIGMVYFASHGEFNMDDATLNRIGPRISKSPEDYLTVLDLERLKPDHLKQTIVFINACYSGRTMTKKGISTGFAEVILSRKADGYIGVTGQVQSEFAQRLAQQLFDTASTNPTGITIPEFLRFMRRRAIDDYEHASDSPRNVGLALIYSHMYIYYGNPLCRLKIRPRSGEIV